MVRWIVRASLACGGLVLASSAALAHPGHAEAGLIHGLLHPFSGLDHLLAMSAVGALAGAMGGRARLGLPVAFLTAMTLGAMLGMAGVAMPAQEFMVAASVLVLGALIALGAPVLPSVAAALVAVFAVAHGLAHGGEMPAGASSVAYIAGFVVATSVLHGIGVGLATLATRLPAHGAPALRLAGAAIAVAGLGLCVGAII